MGRAHAGRLRVLGEAVPEVHAPADVRGAAVGGAARRTRATDAALLDALAQPERGGPRRVPPRHRSAGVGRQARRAARAVSRRASRTRPASRDYLARPAARVRRLSGRRRAAPPQLERPHRRDARAARTTFGAAWVQIDEPKFRFSIRQNYLPNVQGFYYMRLHGRNAAQWWRHEKAEDRYNYLYSADELKEFSETADAARQLVKKALSLHEQSLLGEVGGQRRDDQAAARRAGRRRVPARRSSRAIPSWPASSNGRAVTPSRTSSLITSPRSQPRRHVVARDDVAEHGVLAVRDRAGRPA